MTYETNRWKSNLDWDGEDIGRTKRADFDSRCPACEEIIHKDEVIVRSEGTWVHERCEFKGIVVPFVKIKKAPGFCEHCGLELPLTGECGWC